MTSSTAASWHYRLLDSNLSEADRAALPLEVQAQARSFLDAPAPPQTERDMAEVDAWYFKEGHTVLSEIASAAWSEMAQRAAFAMPAHDARHAMYKVPAAALKHMDAERVSGFERIGVLGALLHDYGRWAEERIFGGPGDSALHARFSFLLTQGLLSEYEMPDLVRYHLLLAPLRHTTGADETDPMPLKLTVAGDRDQLYGPEIVIRLAHHGIDKTWNQSCFYGEIPGTPILNRLAHFHDNRLPGPLFGLASEMDELQRILREFILLCEDADTSRLRWRDSARKASNKATPFNFFEKDWESSWEMVHGKAGAMAVSGSSREALQNLLSAPNLAPSPMHLEEALGKVAHVTAEQDKLLGIALDYVHHERCRLDLREAYALDRIASKNPEDQLVGTLVRLIMKG